jgi:Fe-S cluster assembly ATPase SufC
MSQSKIKIAIIGPNESGKSTIADFLSGHRPTPSAVYKPTVGLRH